MTLSLPRFFLILSVLTISSRIASAQPSLYVDVFGEEGGSFFGSTVGSAGDFDADGFDDLVVGAAGWGNNRGRTYVFRGGEVADPGADFVFTGVNIGDWMGAATAHGDFDGDGYDDVALGVGGYEYLGQSAGGVWIWCGGPDADDAVDFITIGEPGEGGLAYFGLGLASPGDLNADGYDDLVVGAPFFATQGASYVGRIYFYWGGPSLHPIADLTRTGTGEESYLGSLLAPAGDFDGDGENDLLLVADGRVEILFGGSDFDTLSDVVLASPAGTTGFGAVVAGLGDVDGDGHDDVAVGSRGDPEQGQAGAVWVYRGGPNADDQHDFTLPGPDAQANFGATLAGAGDVNDDGYHDILVGADRDDTVAEDAGRAFIYFGGDPLDDTPDWILEGGAAFDRFGIGVAAAGDVNADGVADFVVGSTGDDTAGPGFGSVTVFLGAPSSTAAQPTPALVSALSELTVAPNPFNPRTSVGFDLARDARVRVEVYDLAGRRVSRLADRVLRTGRHTVGWDGTDEAGRAVASGVYMVRVEADRFVQMRRAVLVR